MMFFKSKILPKILGPRPVLRGIFTLILLWALGFSAFTVRVVTYPNNHYDGQTADAIVALTGGKHRIPEALHLFGTGLASHLFISGVNPDVSKQEILNRWGGRNGLPPCCITLGYEAKTTTQNAVESKAWAADNDIMSIILVTSSYHMPRALVEFRDALPDATIIPHAVGYRDTYEEQRIWRLLFTEYHKTLLRWVQLIL